RMPIMAAIVFDTSRIYKAGLRKNDEIIGVDSAQVRYFDELQNQLVAKKNKTVLVTVFRNAKEVQFPAQVDSTGRLGFVPYGVGGDSFEQMDSLGWVKLNVNKYGFFAAFPAGVRKAGEELSSYIDQFKKILNPKTGGYKGLG